MTGEWAGLVFVGATAALALWVVVRRPWCPRTLTAVVGHAILALAALQLSMALVRPASPEWWRFAGLLVAIAPALVYTWLAAAWTALFFRGARSGTAR